MSVTKQLYQLQEVDLELEANEQALKRVSSQLGGSQAVVRAQNELSQQRQSLEELRKQQRSTEWEIDSLIGKLTPTEEKLYSGTISNPKELTNLQHEVDGLKSRREQLEDKALEIMDQVEHTEASIATMSSQLEKLEAEWRRQQQQLSTEAEQLKNIVSELKRQRQLLLDKITTQAAEFYHELKKHKGTAVARVEQGICRGCRISLSVSELQRARGESLVQCSSCGRILFLA